MLAGMGCPSMGIYSWELIHIYGCKNLIRIGTAGTLQPYVHVRDVVFGQGSCTTSNYPALQGVPGTFAPICSYELLEKAVAKAKEMGLHYHVGNILSSDNSFSPVNDRGDPLHLETSDETKFFRTVSGKSGEYIYQAERLPEDDKLCVYLP